MLKSGVETFMQYETILIGQVQDQIASAMPTRFVSMLDYGVKPQPVKLDIIPTPVKRRRTSSSGSAR